MRQKHIYRIVGIDTASAAAVDDDTRRTGVVSRPPVRNARGPTREPPNTALCVCGGGVRDCAGDRPGGVRDLEYIKSRSGPLPAEQKKLAGAPCEHAGGQRRPQFLRGKNRALSGRQGGTGRGFP
jgi:hypothetical protein